MDNIIVGHTDDPNYKPVGHLADGTPVFRYDPIPEKKAVVNQKIINEFNKSVDIADTETQKLLEKFKWDELKEDEQNKLKQRISKGYVEVFNETKPNLTKKEKSVWNDIVDSNYGQLSEYTDDIKRLEPKEDKKKKPKVVKEKSKQSKKKKPKKRARKNTKPDVKVDTSHYTEQFTADKDVVEEEIKPVEPEVKDTTEKSNKTLIESYYDSKEKEREIKERSDSEDVSMSIADYYRKSLEQKREGDTEILGYFDDPEDSKLPVTEDTTEYLDSVVDKDRKQSAKDKERQERKEKNKIEESERESTDIFAEDVEYIDREEVETSTYLELFNTEEKQQQEQEEKIVEQRKAVQKREEKEEKDKKQKQEKAKDRAKKAKKKTEEKKKARDKVITEQTIELQKDYFRDLLEKKYASDEIVEREYNLIKRELEVERLAKRDAAILYLEQSRLLSEKQLAILREYEKNIAATKELIKSTYDPLLEEMDSLSFDTITRGVDDEFDDHTINVNMSSKTVTVIEKESNKSYTFEYRGSLSSYKIDGYQLQLYSISKDPSDYIDPSSPGWFMTHFYTTYDLRTGEAIEKDSHSIVKFDPEWHETAEPEEYSDADKDCNEHTWKHAAFEFTSGQGSVLTPECSAAWETAYPGTTVSAIAPDGFANGYVRIGVKRSGGVGPITIRYIVKPEKPSFAQPADFTIDWDTGANPGWSGDASQVFGSGFYNHAAEALDSEVCLLSANNVGNFEDGYLAKLGGSTVINSVSTAWQTLTWDDGDYEDKYIYLRHSKLGTNSNYQSATKWYSVYLTFSRAEKYNLIADGQTSIFNHVSATTAGIVNDGGTIKPLYDGQDARGSESSPFFVAISGWSTGKADNYDCNPPYGDYPVPAALSGLSATPLSNTSTSLTWSTTGVSPTNIPRVIQIDRSTSQLVGFTQIATIPYGTSYTDTTNNYISDGTYWYRIRGEDNYGDGTWSAVVSAKYIT